MSGPSKRRPVTKPSVAEPSVAEPPVTKRPAPRPRSEEELVELLRSRVADLVQLAPHEVDPDAPHGEHGLDSASALVLAAEIEQELDVVLSPSVAWDHPTLRSLARHVYRQLDARRTHEHA
ncbi:MAG: acyl carrier protein [Sandaracinaceae bacterium]|nr:acyl carrier protein [Sandaracinaceae bacterium]